MGESQNGDGSALPPHNGGTTSGNGFGLAAVIVGSVALVGALLPVINYATGILALVGLVLGIMGWVIKGRKRASAIVGTVISVLALVLSIVLAVVYTAGIATSVVDWIQKSTPSATEVPLQYEVTGDGATASVTYATFTAGAPSEKKIPAAPLPFSQELTVTVGAEDEFNIFTVTAVADPGTSLTCTITLDGQVIEEQTAYDTCSASYVPDY